MSTYAIGDIQGCREQLEALLELIRFDPATDKLWFAGDLVNRGPDPLGTLRLIHSIRDRVVVVLGNHDLHMLAMKTYLQLGLKTRGSPKDNFYPVFDAPDVEELLEWLRFCPLVHAKNEFLLVHAGVYPQWDRARLLGYAAEVELVLRSKQSTEFFLQMYGDQPDNWSSQLKEFERLRFITNTLTRMRYCFQDHSLDMLFKGPVREAKSELIPWFSVKNRVEHQGYILHGHWAALLDAEPAPGIISLDTGCVWGNKLSAWCLEDKNWYSVPGYMNVQ